MSLISARLFRNSIVKFPKKLIWFEHKCCLTSISKRIEDRKIERLLLLRNAITDIYSNSDKSKFDWHKAREELIRREVHFPSNFEFVLLSAFDPTMSNENQNFILDRDLFEEICLYVSESEVIKSNKIASVRFCVFLSRYPKYLNQTHIDYIRRTADLVANDSVQIHPVIIDIIQALSNSSAENCRLALELFPRFLKCGKKSFSLKLDLLNILFRSLIHHKLNHECMQFLEEYTRFIQADLNTVGQLLSMIASTRITKKFTRNNLLEIINSLSKMHTAIMIDDVIVFVDKVLKQKLGYRNIQDSKIDPVKGLCSCCGQQLTGLTREEFLQLKSHFKSIIFDLNDQYLMDNLTEYQLQLTDFESKIVTDDKKEPKYDLIVDGLNVSYRRSKSIVHDKTGLRQFAKVYKIKDIDNQIVTIMETNQLMAKYRRLLLIGRQHMKTWFQLKRMCQKHQEKIDLSLLLNRTRDDNYILYAAIQHPETMILSSDYFRDHQNKFSEWYRQDNDNKEYEKDRPNLGLIFQRWLKSRQIRIVESLQLKYPNRFDIRIHLHRQTSKEHSYPVIHIPVILNKDPCDEDHEIVWVCAQPS